MDRRKALKQLGIMTGGIVLLPSCKYSKENTTIALKNLKITADHETLLKSLVGTIIPEGNIAGANSLFIHDFVWIMVDDLLDTDDQQFFLKGLNYFQKEILKIKGKPFEKLSSKIKLESLQTMQSYASNKIDISIEALLYFIEQTKKYTILGYMRSEYIMTGIMPYEQVPGSYGSCETIDTTKRINING